MMSIWCFGKSATPIQVPRRRAARVPHGFDAVLLAMVLSCPAIVRAADADADPVPSMFSLHGFGTLGVAHSDAHEADFVGSPFQPNGAGFRQPWSPGVDSKVGLQLGAQFTAKLSAIVQVVSQHIYDNTWRPQLEWAHLMYQLTPDLSIRAGRSVAAPFMLSDTHLVGYTYPWIRPPLELYDELPVSNLDGVDVNYHLRNGVVDQSLSISYGQTRLAILDGGEVSARKFLQASDAIDVGSLTFRIGYTSLRATTDIPSLDPLFAGFTQFGTAASSLGFLTSGAQASELAAFYSSRELSAYAFSMATVGIDYDPGQWLLMSEWAKTASDGLQVSSTSGYVTGGYRFARFTPFLTIARVKSARYVEPGIAPVGLPPILAAEAAALNGGLTAALRQFTPSQSSVTVGMRWDLMKDIDIKLQYDRIRLDFDSDGRLGNVQPGFLTGPDVNVVSLAIDFVF
jgi:hypothetical protein